MNKSFYYLVTWDEASYLRQTLEELGIEHAVESSNEAITIHDGRLAIVFPVLPVRAYSAVRELFECDHWLPYPSLS